MSRWLFLTLLLLFLGGHAVCRCLTYAHLEYDEAEQLTLVQTFSVGYYYQPPLFTWLLWPFAQFLGPNIYALLVLRTILFVLYFVLAYRVSIRLCPDDRSARLATLLLVLIPEVFNGAFGMWTHTSLLLVLVLATLLVVLRLQLNPTTRDYLWLGVCGGLGVLGKYNYIHFAAALMLAMACSAAWRPILIDRRFMLSVGIGFFLLVPHGLWMMEHAHEVRHGVLRYTEIRADQLDGWPGMLKHLTVNLFQTSARSFGFILAPLLLLIIPTWKQAGRTEIPEAVRLVVRMLVAAAVLLVLVMILGGIRHLRQHWFTPFTILLPAIVLARFDLARLAAWRLQGLQSVLVIAVVGALAWRGSLIMKCDQLGQLNTRDQLYTEQAAYLRSVGWDGQIAVTDHPFTAGYLRLHFPRAQVRCTYFPSHHVEIAKTESVLLAWFAGVSEEARYRQLTEALGIADSSPRQEGVKTLRENVPPETKGWTVLRSWITPRPLQIIQVSGEPLAFPGASVP
jgi:4-amino-4-deoxy-L-arabinose transferase-like glycosyltransferase